MANMNVNSLKANLTNPARGYLWEVVFPTIIGGAGDTDTLLLRATSTVKPGRGVGEIKVPFKQTAGIKYPGKLTFPQTWKCTFIEGTDRKIFDAIHAWQQKIVNDTDGTGSVAADLKTDILLNLIDNEGTVFEKVKLIGCYIQDVPDVALDMATEDVIKYDVTFSYDSWTSSAA